MNPQVQVAIRRKVLLMPLGQVHLISDRTAEQQNAATVALSPALHRSSLQPADHGERFQPRHVAAAVIACLCFQARCAPFASGAVRFIDRGFTDGMQWISAATGSSE
jgi:hypothetical protein